VSYGGRALSLVALLAGCSPASKLASSPHDMGPRPDFSLGGSSPSPDMGGLPTTPTTPTAPPPDLAPPLTAIRIHYPVGTHALALRGDTAPLNWDKGLALTGTNGDFTYTFASTPSTPVQFKPLLDDTTWSHGANYVVKPGETVDVYPHFVATQGTVKKLFDAFSSKILTYGQPVWVYLPPSYDENTLAHYPVLYAQDGQNLFDPTLAFQGNEWKIDETLDAAAEGQPPPTAIREIIVIGPEAGPNRNPDYTPTYDQSQGFGGDGDKYLRMLVEELKPQVDQMLRTLPGRETTGILGSSLGGLISAYAGCTHADTFGLVGAMSPSTWWDNTMIIGTVGKMAPAPMRPLRVYVDSGDSGVSNDDVTDTNQLAATYLSMGYTDSVNFKHIVQAGGQHSEIYWAQRVPGAMQFLFGSR
jgi:predicted alpha/beta superfamily hydrolase